MKKTIVTLATIAVIGATAFARPGGKGGPQFERPNPEDIVAEIVADYDANEDNLVNATELAAAITGMHEKRIAEMKARMAERNPDGDTDRPRGKGPRGDRERPPVEEAAAHLIENFDENGDEVLDTEELLGAVDAMHHMHRKGPRHGGPGKRGPRGPQGEE